MSPYILKSFKALNVCFKTGEFKSIVQSSRSLLAKTALLSVTIWVCSPPLGLNVITVPSNVLSNDPVLNPLSLSGIVYACCLVSLIKGITTFPLILPESLLSTMVNVMLPNSAGN